MTILNPKFRQFLCNSEQCLTVLALILIESLDARIDPKQFGTLRMCCIFLQTLSEDRNFGTHLNNMIDMSLLGSHQKTFPNLHYGCWADALFIFVITMISTPSPAKAEINYLQESYLSILSNCAPIVTKFNTVTCNRIFALFSLFSSPKYLLAKEKNYSKLFYLIYIIDSIIQYQYYGNIQLIYTFVRNSQKVLALRDLRYEDLSAKIEIVSPSTPTMQQPSSTLISEGDALRKPDFIHTEVWFKEWKSKLPIQVLSTLVETLSPILENFVLEKDLNADTKVLEYLASRTMVGVLPQPHPIIVHRFVYSMPLRHWIRSYIWVILSLI